MTESDMLNDQAKESQITKLRIKSTEKTSFIVVFQQKLAGNLKKVYLCIIKKSQKGVMNTEKKSQKGVKWRHYEA